MTSTDELRRLLDERGIEWSSPELSPNQTRLPYVKFEPWGEGTLKVTMFNIAPEQAIAVTLGDDDYECRMDELLCRLTNGKWSKSRSYSVDFMVSCVDEAYEDAALGNGTCRNEWVDYGKFRCSECWTQVDAISTNTTRPMPIRYCPNCGRRVER